MPKFLKKNYHWIIAVVLFFVTCVRGGASNNLTGLHLIPVTEALNITRTQFSLAASASSLVSMLSAMASGALIMRYGHRPLLVFFLLVQAGAYALMASAQSYAVFFTGFVLIGTAVGVVAEAGSTRLVSVWFHKHRGTVLGVITSATGLGGSILCIFQTAVIERSGYRSSFWLVTALFATCAVLAFVFIRSHPSKVGLLPYGDGEKIEYKKRERDDHWHGLSMKQLVRRPTFYMMMFGTLLSCALPYLAYYVVVPHFQDQGLSTAQASSLQSILLLCLTGAKILAGYLCDKIGARKVVLLCMVCDVIALVLMVIVKSYAMAVVTMVIFAMALPVMSVIIPMLASSLFGYQAQAAYNGIFISMLSAAAMISNPVTNAIYDRIGTYSYTFLVAAGLTVLLMGGYLLMYRLADKDRKIQEAEEAQR